MKSKAFKNISLSHNIDSFCISQKNNKRNIDFLNIVDSKKNKEETLDEKNVISLNTNTVIETELKNSTSDNNKSQKEILNNTDINNNSANIFFNNISVPDQEIKKKENLQTLQCKITLLNDTVKNGFRLNTSENISIFLILVEDHCLKKTFYCQIEPKYIEYTIEEYKLDNYKYPIATTMFLSEGSPREIYIYIDIDNYFGYFKIDRIQSHGYVDFNMRTIDNIII